MALDPRLASTLLLALAAKRAKERQATQPGGGVVIRIAYDAYGDEPPPGGEQSVIYLPNKAPSIEAWYRATEHFRARLRAPGDGAC
jgi:hypothetical protein